MRVHPSAFPLKTKKIMKKSLFMVAVLLLSLCMFTFSACDDNEEDKNVGKPVVALNEVGEENRPPLPEATFTWRARLQPRTG